MLNLNTIRAQFPALNQLVNNQSPIFFDSPGGSQVSYHVIDAMTHYLSHFSANLGAPSFNSKQTELVMQSARQAVAALLNAESETNIVFGPSATAITFNISRAISLEWQKGDEIIVSALDHYSNVSPWMRVAQEKGVIVHQIKANTNHCEVDYEHLETLVNKRTRLIATTYASNLTGSLVNVKKVCDIAKSVNALSFIDAVHFAPHSFIDVQQLNCDFLTISGYKFTGPHLAAIYGKSAHWERMNPYKVEPAANVNPNRWEQGTQNFSAMAGLNATINYLASLSDNPETDSLRKKLENAFSKIIKHEKTLSETFLTHLLKYPQIKLYGKTTAEGRTPTFAFSIENQSPAEFVKYAAEHNICIGSGNFYAQGLCEQLQLGNDGVIRAGCMHYHSKEEIIRFFEVLDTYLKSK